jgi:hypothetical protein
MNFNTKKEDKKIIILCLIFIILITIASIVYSAPIGPTVTYISNSTRTTPGNATRNESTGGGYIYTINLDGIEQNGRWKAYIGNVTGSLTLDDASSNTIYNWNLGTVTGEVYATRNVSLPTWTQVNCTWAGTGNGTFANSSNRTIEDRENTALQHTRLDNITATFSQRNHSSFDVGTRTITANSCYSIFPWVNDSSQSTTTFFPEVLLYDGTNLTDYSAGLIYAAIIENDIPGFDNATYDFQMLVPEVGSDSWSSSTAYYFYVELT